MVDALCLFYFLKEIFYANFRIFIFYWRITEIPERIPFFFNFPEASLIASAMTSAKLASPQPMDSEPRTAETNNNNNNAVDDPPVRKSSPALDKLPIPESKGHPERKRRASSESGDVSFVRRQ